MEKNKMRSWGSDIIKFLSDNYIALSSLVMTVFIPIFGPSIKKYSRNLFDRHFNKREYDAKIQKLENENEKTNIETTGVQAKAAQTNVITATNLLEEQRKVFKEREELWNNRFILMERKQEEIELHQLETDEKLKNIQEENLTLHDENKKLNATIVHLEFIISKLNKTIIHLESIISELKKIVKKFMSGIDKLSKYFDTKKEIAPWTLELTKTEKELLSDDFSLNEGENI